MEDKSMSTAYQEVKILTVASCSFVRDEHRSHVVVSGSYGDRYNAFNAAKWGVRGVIMNDAGNGKNNAGIRGLDYLDQIYLAAATLYKGRSIDIKQVGRELGVRYVLEGSVRKAGQRVRITGQLIDAITGTDLWTDHISATTLVCRSPWLTEASPEPELCSVSSRCNVPVQRNRVAPTEAF
jgi:hypothetical protein